MATYVPNVNPYLPNVKAFTPDYKFLTDTLQQRQTKYDTNYKQLNNAYSKIMYAGLSRQDTKEARDQFVNNLQPELEKISGLDLSLGQNVRAAQAVFQPFYDNDLVVKDMVMTKDYQNKMAYAQQLASSTNEEESDRYWDEGVQLLKYKMDDFINASQDEALATQLPSYIENPRLYKRAMDYFNKQGYKVKYDKLSPGNDFIITDTNGKNITSTALADLKMRFQNNDVIKKGYYAKSYVDSRNFANNQMKSGNVSSIAEGILKYNTGTLQTYKAQNEMQVVKYNEQITTLNSQLESINDQLKGQAVKPGSAVDNNIKLLENQIQGLEMQKEMAIKTATQADNMLSSGNAQMINQGAYNVQMQSNIDKDLKMAANNYSMLTAERTIKVNQAELQRRKEVHDVKMSNMRFQQDVKLKEIETEEQAKRTENKIKTYLRYGLTPDGKAVETTAAGQIAKQAEAIGLSADPGLFNIEDKALNEQTVLSLNESYLQTIETDISNNELENYIAATSRPDKLVKIPDGVTVEGNDRKFVIMKEGNKAFVSQDMFRKIIKKNEQNYEAFQNANINFFNTAKIESEAMAKYHSNFINNQESIVSLKKKKNKLYKISQSNLEIARKLSDKKNEMPIIFQEKDGDYTKLNKEELYDLTVNKISNSDKLNWKFIAYNSLIDKGNSIITLKDKNDQVWQDLKNGDVSKTIIRINQDGKEEEIVNPAFFQVKLYNNISEKQKDFDKQKQTDIANFMKSTGIWQYNKKQSLNSLLEQVPVINYSAISRESDKSYDEQIALTNDINTNNYGEAEEQQLGFEYVNFMAADRNDTTPYSDMPDLIFQQSKTYQINDKQTKTAQSVKENKNIIDQGIYLREALSLPGTMVAQDLGRVKDQTTNDIVLQDPSKAKLFMYNEIQKWMNGNLGDKYTYNITYTPAVGDEQYSKYKITRSQTIGGTQTKSSKQRIGDIEISVPLQEDRNILNPKNDKSQYVISDLIDETTGTYERDFSSGSSINILYSGGTWSIDYNLMQYDPKTDGFTTQMPSNLLKNYGIEDLRTTDISVANEKYEQMTSWFSRWEFKQYENAAKKRKEFNDYLTSRGITDPQEEDWTKFLNNK